MSSGSSTIVPTFIRYFWIWLHYVIEIASGEGLVGHGAGHLLEQLVAVEGPGAGAAPNMLSQHVEPAGFGVFTVQGVRLDGFKRGTTLEHLETIAGHKQGLGGFVELVIGAAKTLQQARDAFRRADLHNKINRRPINAKIKRGGRNDRFQRAARHGAFNLAALFSRQRTVMQADGQVVLVEPPEFLKQQLALGAGVDEDQGCLVLLDPSVELFCGMQRHMPGPGQTFFGDQDFDLRLCTWLTQHAGHLGIVRVSALREPGGQIVRILDRRREPDAPGLGRQLTKPCKPQRQQIAALVIRQSMQLVDYDALEAIKDLCGVGVGKQQRQALRRGEQDLWRLGALTLAFGLRCVARAGLDGDI